MRSKKGYIILVSAIIIFGLLLVSGTYAWLMFTANVTNASYVGETTCFYIDYDITNDDGSLPITGTLFQSSTPKGGLSGKVSMNIRSDCSVQNGTGTIKLNVASTTSSLLLSEGALKYAVYENVNSDPVSTGVISTTGDMVVYQNFSVTHTPSSYYIYVWLDGNIADNDYVNLPFSGYVHASATQNETGGSSSCVIYYDARSGTGGPGNQSIVEGEPFTISSVVPGEEDAFSFWMEYDEENGCVLGNQYSPGSVVNLACGTKLIAIYHDDIDVSFCF